LQDSYREHFTNLQLRLKFAVRMMSELFELTEC
jgi:hypothetical protein